MEIELGQGNRRKQLQSLKSLFYFLRLIAAKDLPVSDPCLANDETRLRDRVPLYAEVDKFITPRTRLLALAQVPNTTGVIAPVREWVDAAHARGLPALVDASQSAGHMPIDVREIANVAG